MNLSYEEHLHIMTETKGYAVDTVFNYIEELENNTQNQKQSKKEIELNEKIKEKEKREEELIKEIKNLKIKLGRTKAD